MRTEQLGQIAQLNPSLPVSLKDDESVAFLPMAAVDETSLSTVERETRAYSEVKKGYTPFAQGDVLVAKITPCFENGKITQATINRPFGFGSTEFHVVRPDPTRLNGRYLTHYLRQDFVRAQGQRRMTGSAGQRRVPPHFLAELAIPLPSLSEQRRIADILDKADALRAKRREAIAAVEELQSATFHYVCGDAVPVSKTWPRVPLAELISEGPQNGIYKPSTEYGSGTLILRIDGFYDGLVTDVTTLKRVRLTADELSSYSLRDNDIVINRVNSREYLGKSALIPRLPEPVVFESNMMRFSLNTKRVDPVFLVRFLQTSSVRAHILKSAKDAINQSSINQQDVKSIPVLLPPLAQQQIFRQRFDAIEQVMHCQLASAKATNAMFMSLQHRAFNGGLGA